MNLQKPKKLNIDSYCALEDLKYLIKKKSLFEIDDKTFNKALKSIDNRISVNLNTSHVATINQLPFGLKYILNGKFFCLYLTFSVILMKWFLQSYFNVLCNLVHVIVNSKVSLSQVLYTDSFHLDRVKLFASLADNPIVTKGLQIYHLQFGWNSQEMFCFLKNALVILWQKTTLETRRQTMWDIFDVHMRIKDALVMRETTMSAIVQSVSNGIHWSLSTIALTLKCCLPTTFTKDVVDTAYNKVEETKEGVYKTVMATARGGKVPSFDIARITSVVDELSFMGDFFYNIFSKVILCFFVLIFIYFIIFVYSWYDASCKKSKILSLLERQKLKRIFENFFNEI